MVLPSHASCRQQCGQDQYNYSLGTDAWTRGREFLSGQSSTGMFHRPAFQLSASHMLHLSPSTNSENKFNKLSSPDLIVKKNLTYIATYGLLG
jgi:hypothetical protein